MVVNKLIEHLMYTGLSEYEARAYVGLLGRHPATAYELAKASGIPTSKIYEVVARLEEKEIISAMAGDGTKKYIPLEPGEFVETRRNLMSSTLATLAGELHAAGEGADISYIWNIREYDYLIDKALRTTKEARETLLVSAWHEEMALLTAALREAEQRGVKVAVVHFGRVKEKAGQLYTHPIHDTIYAEKGGRGLVMVADTASALVGTIFDEHAVEGAYSTNRGFVTLAEDYIKHDIYVMKLVRRFDRELTERFGPRYEKLRDVFTDRENR
jgi:sugar-specific transcriptional regulator TrmB